ncbi:MAG: PTS ascorbate transporter subunit IIC [Actinomycetia bacterium]|nr:PTS ascorbate transporter subunit IIC [Actinomycetes bacterium]
MPVAGFIGQQILAVPAYLIGAVTAIGLIVLRRKATQVIGGALKAALGYLVIGVGVGVVTAALGPAGALVVRMLGVDGVVPPEASPLGLISAEYGAQAAYVLLLGFVVMLVLARVTPLRYVFLTGHHMVFMAVTLTVLLTGGLPQASWLVVVVGGFLLGVAMVVMPALAHPFTRKVTGDDTIAIGHFGTMGFIAAGFTGWVVGKKSPSADDIVWPRSLRFLREPMLAMASSMVVLYLVVAVWGLFAVPFPDAAAVFGASPDGAGAYLAAAFAQALQFGVGTAIVMFGAKTVLGEIVPAFDGLAARLVPGAKPALDIPLFFRYAPNAVLIGFVGSFLGGLATLVVLTLWLGPAFGLVVVLPGMAMHFFSGGGAGVYGNATGGRLGALCGGFVNGVMVSVVTAFLLMLVHRAGFPGNLVGGADLGWFGSAIGLGLDGGPVLGVIVDVLLGCSMIFGASTYQRLLTDRGWTPGIMREYALMRRGGTFAG